MCEGKGFVAHRRWVVMEAGAAAVERLRRREGGGEGEGGGTIVRVRRCVCSPSSHPGSFRCRQHHRHYVWRRTPNYINPWLHGLWRAQETRVYKPNWWVLLGEVGTGKTSLVQRFVKGQFSEYQESTIGAAFFTQALSLNEGTIRLDIWDTAGQERYHSLAPMYYRGAAAAIVVYDITNKDSFVRAKKWVQQLQRQGKPGLIMFLVANKVDLEDKRAVGNEEAEQYAKENGLFFLETSAKTAQNVNELFYEIAKTLAKANNPSRETGIVLHRRPEESRSLFCCS